MGQNDPTHITGKVRSSAKPETLNFNDVGGVKMTQPKLKVKFVVPNRKRSIFKNVGWVILTQHTLPSFVWQIKK
ncbi:MAG TPA: hypothetical protein PK657_08640 [Legionella sp.]|nr:hypothetical protein [Legionella sp.]